MEELRIKTRILKAKYNITFRELAKRLQMNYKSFYNWLNNKNINLSIERQIKLKDIIESYQQEV